MVGALVKRKASKQMTRTGGSKMARQMGKELLMAGLQAMAPEFGAAVRVGKAAYSGARRVYKTATGKKKPSNVPVKRSKFNNTSTGVYAGKFKKVKKVKTTIESLALKKGYGQSVESHGRMSDPSTCYIGHSTTNVAIISRVLLGNFIRKVMQKAGYHISNRVTPINAFDISNGDGFKFVLQQMDPTTGGIIQANYTTVGSDSLETILTNWVTGFNFFLDYFNFVTQNEPTRLLFYSSDRNGLDTNWRLASEILISEEIVELSVKSTITIQNRSAGASAVAGNLDIDRVDNQPIKSHRYKFSQATPRLKDNSSLDNQDALSQIPASGYQLLRSAQLNLDFQDAPVGEYWSNCTGISKTVLQPGTIRKSSIVHIHRGKLHTVMKRIRPIKKVAGVNFAGGAGKSELYCLEELLRTSEANPITIQYERDFECYCISKAAKKNALTKKLIVDAELNNLAP